MKTDKEIEEMLRQELAALPATRELYENNPLLQAEFRHFFYVGWCAGKPAGAAEVFEVVEKMEENG